jgi:hypothetical protein
MLSRARLPVREEYGGWLQEPGIFQKVTDTVSNVFNDRTEQAKVKCAYYADLHTLSFD